MLPSRPPSHHAAVTGGSQKGGGASGHNCPPHPRDQAHFYLPRGWLVSNSTSQEGDLSQTFPPKRLTCLKLCLQRGWLISNSQNRIHQWHFTAINNKTYSCFCFWKMKSLANTLPFNPIGQGNWETVATVTKMKNYKLHFEDFEHFSLWLPAIFLKSELCSILRHVKLASKNTAIEQW